MWYRFSSNKNNIDKYNLSLLELSKDWFESVPENIWIYKSKKIKILKSIVVENNSVKNIFIVKKDSKELDKFNNIDDAVKFVEKN